MTCAPIEDSDQPGHHIHLNLLMTKTKQNDLCAQRRLRSAWASAQSDRWIRMFAVPMKKPWVFSYPLSAQQRLIRLGGCLSQLIMSYFRRVVVVSFIFHDGRRVIIIIIIITLFQEYNIFGMYASLTYGLQLQR